MKVAWCLACYVVYYCTVLIILSWIEPPNIITRIGGTVQEEKNDCSLYLVLYYTLGTLL
jgi:hypothetical protein